MNDPTPKGVDRPGSLPDRSRPRNPVAVPRPGMDPAARQRRVVPIESARPGRAWPDSPGNPWGNGGKC